MADEPVEQIPGEAKDGVRKEYKFIRWDDSGDVAHLTLNRPKQNVMNIGMLREMASAIDSLSTREDVRLILLAASPECEGYFSLGVGAEGYTQQMVFQMMDAFHSVFRVMIEVSKPVLAVVDGVASGAGAARAPASIPPASSASAATTRNARAKARRARGRERVGQGIWAIIAADDSLVEPYRGFPRARLMLTSRP